MVNIVDWEVISISLINIDLHVFRAYTRTSYLEGNCRDNSQAGNETLTTIPDSVPFTKADICTPVSLLLVFDFSTSNSRCS